MASQPKPAPRPEPKPTPKPGPGGPAQPATATQPHQQPGQQPHPGQPGQPQPSQPGQTPQHPPGQPQHDPHTQPGHERQDHERREREHESDDDKNDPGRQHGMRARDDDDVGVLHDERHDPGPDRDRAVDRRTGQIPGTPYTPPEGHDHREPGPGEPGGPGGRSLQGGNPAPPARTIADEQRERSEELQRAGVERQKAAHDERTGNEPKQVPGVSPTAGVTPGEPGAVRR
jgi:hypothetical protein